MVSQCIINRILLSKAPQKGGSFFQRGRWFGKADRNGFSDIAERF